MHRAKWKCEFCKNDKSTLHVHHLKYHGEPWDTPAEDLECLCDDCHDARHKDITVTIPAGSLFAAYFNGPYTARESRFIKKYMKIVCSKRWKAHFLKRKEAAK